MYFNATFIEGTGRADATRFGNRSNSGFTPAVSFLNAYPPWDSAAGEPMGGVGGASNFTGAYSVRYGWDTSDFGSADNDVTMVWGVYPSTISRGAGNYNIGTLGNSSGMYFQHAGGNWRLFQRGSSDNAQSFMDNNWAPAVPNVGESSVTNQWYGMVGRNDQATKDVRMWTIDTSGSIIVSTDGPSSDTTGLNFMPDVNGGMHIGGFPSSEDYSGYSSYFMWNGDGTVYPQAQIDNWCRGHFHKLASTMTGEHYVHWTKYNKSTGAYVSEGDSNSITT